MSDEQRRNTIIERLRLNTKLAGISLTDDDIQSMQDKGFLGTVIAFETIADGLPSDFLPDYLKDWDDSPSVSPLKVEGAAFSSSDSDSIAGIAPKIKAGEVSPVELTKQALSKIAEKDRELNAFQLVLAEQAIAAAQQAEREIAQGQYRGPLHGVPVAVKDLLAMRGTITTAGSKILADNLTDYDSAGVERLQKAGAVIVGKTRMSEFAYSPGSNNGHYGPTRNPYNPEFDTGGSSSGSGSAVGAGLVFGALGTDTGGSIRIPGSFCGVVGLKPTFGRVSLFGGTTLSWSLDHLGPMTRTVTDAALMLEVLAGHDPRDIRTRPNSDWSAAAANLEGGVKGLRIGVLRDSTQAELATAEMMAGWQKGLKTLEEQGAELIEIDLPYWKDLWNINGAIIGLEATTFHAPWLASRLSDYGDFMRHRVLVAYGYSPRAFVQAQQARTQYRQKISAIWQQVDLLSTPTMPYAALPLGKPASTILTGPFNLLGWPTISVPVGCGKNNLPLGLQLAGKPWDEATVLRAARTLEASFEL